MSRLVRLERLEAHFRAVRDRSFVPPVVWCEVTDACRPVGRVVAMVMWPLREARAWDRPEGEDEAAFLARVEADAPPGAILVPERLEPEAPA